MDLAVIDEAVTRAAIEPSYWVTAMNTVAAATGSAVSVLLPLHGRHPGLPFSEALQPMMQQYFAEGWHTRDERTRGLYIFNQRGSFSDLDLLPPDEIKRLAYYQDLMGRHGLRWFGGIIVKSGPEIWCICIQRTIAQGPFSSQEIETFGRWSKKLGGAAALAGALGFAEAKATLDAFDLSATPVVLVDARAFVHAANDATRHLFQSGVLRLTERRLATVSRDATIALERALRDLIWQPGPSTMASPIVITRPLGRRPVIAYPVRLPAFDANPFGPARVAIVFRDLDAAPQALLDDLKAIFGLTLAEAKVAQTLLSGATVEDLAATHAISPSTARVHLKSIFAKTQTNRQSELLAVLTRAVRPQKASRGGPAGAPVASAPDLRATGQYGIAAATSEANWRRRS